MNPPNILLVMNDDMGYSDIGCYGGEVRTPNLDRLAARGVRLTQFYNTARCCPTRASILTGLHPHQAGVGWMTARLDEDGYRGDLNDTCVTIGEALKVAGYATYMSGKWHVSHHQGPDGPKYGWPCQRGFDRYFGILGGAANYWQPSTLTRDNDAVDLASLPEDFFLTDAISDQAADYIREHAATNGDAPFFLYTAYSAPHWPLHAHEDDIRRYRGRFAAGWDRLREERLQRMRAMGIVDTSWPMTERDSTQPPWDETPHKAWQQRRMEVYAAQIDRMDQGIGRIVAALEETNRIDNTLILFLADNGACAEEFAAEVRPLPPTYPAGKTQTRDGRTVMRGNDPTVMPGPEDTYQSYGVPWANLSNTPFREYKHWVHEGGIATPLIAHWPSVIDDRGRPAAPAGPTHRHHGDLPRRGRRRLSDAIQRQRHRAPGGDESCADIPRSAQSQGRADLGTRGQQGGTSGTVETGVQVSRRMGTLRHRCKSHGNRGPGGAASGDRGRTRRHPRCVGRALRRQVVGSDFGEIEIGEREGWQRKRKRVNLRTTPAASIADPAW